MQVNRGQIAVNWVRLLAIPILIISILAISACTPQPTNCAREDVFCVGLVTTYEGIDDHALNQSAWETLQNIQTQAGMARLDMIESIDTRDWQKNVSFFAENNYDVVVTVGRNLSEATVAVAAKYSNTLFIGIDQQLEQAYANIATIYFAVDQAGFLAGRLAAMVTEGDTVGAVCETSGIDSVWRYCEGFRIGARYENDDIRVLVVYRESGSRDDTFNDPEWGKERVSSLIDSGADVLTAYGGGTAQGAYLRAMEKGIPIIGAEEDLYFRLPDVQPVLITSVINDPSLQLSYLVLMASQGENSVGSFAGQITYAPFRGPNRELENEAEDLLQGIRNGEFEIDLPVKK
ncbi:MAG: BMP family ABC transporter substrate-binding protein [Anaerolineales bacterium]